MRRRFLVQLAVAVGVMAGLAPRGLAQEEFEVPRGVEVLTRGNVHEGFAMPGQGELKQPGTIDVQPPAPIEELPPDEKPDGDNVVWLAGYWAWDNETKDFFWVSGCWRDAPPGQQWVPGNWQRVGDGWSWVNGFWSDDDDGELPYLPEPPESLERGPTVAQPSADSFYVPGCWIWREVRYAWRPGFWMRSRPDWVWTPAHYVWTPAGCIFAEGHWDHPLHERGLLFAPVRIDRRVAVRGWVYQPRFVIHTDALMGALFVRPNRRGYMFGDYFAAQYQTRGFAPWIDYRPARNVFDINFNYYRHSYAKLNRWEDNVRALYIGRSRGEIPPPPRTLVQQNQFIKKINIDRSQNTTVNKTVNITNVQNVSMVTNLKQINNTKVTALNGLGRPVGTPIKDIESKKTFKLETVNKQQQQRYKENIQQQREIETRRAQLETKNRIVKPVKPEEYNFDTRLKLNKQGQGGPKPEARKKQIPPGPTIKAEERIKLPPGKGGKDKPQPPKGGGKDKQPPPRGGVEDRKDNQPPPPRGGQDNKDKQPPPPPKGNKDNKDNKDKQPPPPRGGKDNKDNKDKKDRKDKP